MQRAPATQPTQQPFSAAGLVSSLQTGGGCAQSVIGGQLAGAMLQWLKVWQQRGCMASQGQLGSGAGFKIAAQPWASHCGRVRQLGQTEGQVGSIWETWKQPPNTGVASQLEQ